jgi:predicted AlkP superfamily pyrophosphatase or phosphodiesterase
VDHTAVDQFVSVWDDAPDPPIFTWVNFTLTDAAFHEGGPYSEMAAASVRDTDARLGKILERVERSGRWNDCAFFLVADHGMEESDPAVRGDWDVALAASQLPVRDEGYGFLYLTPS